MTCQRHREEAMRDWGGKYNQTGEVRVPKHVPALFFLVAILGRMRMMEQPSDFDASCASHL